MTDEDPSQKSDRWQIRVRGIEKSFGDHHVLRGIDLDVERGKINIVIGGSGQGKSVLMKHLMGLLKPDKGQIWVDGEDIVPLDDVQMNRVRLKFGMAFQYSALFDSLTVEENVAFPLVEHTRKKKDEIRGIAKERLEFLGFRTSSRIPGRTVGGMQNPGAWPRALVDRQFC